MTYFNWPVIETTVFTEMSVTLRRPIPTKWSRASKGGAPVDCFLEGPCWDTHGNLWLVDIPYSRILHISPQGDWDVMAECDGGPNGLALRRDSTLLTVGYKDGLLSLDPTTSAVTPFLTRCNSEHSKDPDDLIVAHNDGVYFTNQDRTGLHGPTGRVYRLRTDGRLDCLPANGPSPNGLVLTPGGSTLFAAMMRDSAVWRLSLLADGNTSKVGRFVQFYGTGNPDGMVVDAAGHLFAAHASLGAVFVVPPYGEPLARTVSYRGRTITSVAPAPDGQSLVITKSATGTVLRAH